MIANNYSTYFCMNLFFLDKIPRSSISESKGRSLCVALRFSCFQCCKCSSHTHTHTPALDTRVFQPSFSVVWRLLVWEAFTPFILILSDQLLCSGQRVVQFQSSFLESSSAGPGSGRVLGEKAPFPPEPDPPQKAWVYRVPITKHAAQTGLESSLGFWDFDLQLWWLIVNGRIYSHLRDAPLSMPVGSYLDFVKLGCEDKAIMGGTVSELCKWRKDLGSSIPALCSQAAQRLQAPPT